jgi:hypothetical protein
MLGSLRACRRVQPAASAGSAQRADEVEADYTTSHLMISETAHESVPITIFFDPRMSGVETAEVFTNLNRRDWATAAPNGDGVEEGIVAPSGNGISPGDERRYYKSYPMSPVAETGRHQHQPGMRDACCGYREQARNLDAIL